jgi:hypothetical protein
LRPAQSGRNRFIATRINPITKIPIIFSVAEGHVTLEPDASPDERWRDTMKILIRVALIALNLTAGIPAVANAETTPSAPAPTQQDNTASWANG